VRDDAMRALPLIERIDRDAAAAAMPTLDVGRSLVRPEPRANELERARNAVDRARVLLRARCNRLRHLLHHATAFDDTK